MSMKNTYIHIYDASRPRDIMYWYIYRTYIGIICLHSYTLRYTSVMYVLIIKTENTYLLCMYPTWNSEVYVEENCYITNACRGIYMMYLYISHTHLHKYIIFLHIHGLFVCIYNKNWKVHAYYIHNTYAHTYIHAHIHTYLHVCYQNQNWYLKWTVPKVMKPTESYPLGTICNQNRVLQPW